MQTQTCGVMPQSTSAGSVRCSTRGAVPSCDYSVHSCVLPRWLARGGDLSTDAPTFANRAGYPSNRMQADAGTNTESEDRKSTRLNSSHSQISYAVFCLKKKTKIKYN